MSADEKRIKEANECIQKAKEHLKTSFFRLKTKPEYDLAAYEYARAAVCYRNANRLDLCRDMYLEEANCYNNTKNLFHEAKAKENAAMACRDAKEYEKAQKLYSESVDCYFASGSLTTAAQTLDKAAKMLEPVLPEHAAELYEKGLSFVSQDDTAKTAINFYTRLIGLYLKLERFADARRIARDSIEKFCEIGEFGKIGNVVLGMALIELKIGDSVAALKSLEHMPASIVNMFSSEINALKCLIKAYDEFDDESFQNCLKNPIWKTLDIEYVRLIRTLKAPVGENPNSNCVSENNAGVVDDDEDDEDNIC